MINFLFRFYLPGFVDSWKFVVDDDILFGSGRIIGINNDDDDDGSVGWEERGGWDDALGCSWICVVVWGFFDIHCLIVFELIFCSTNESRNSGCS